MVSGMIERLAIFGATGDLTGRYLLPGLAALRAGGYLGDGFRLIAAGREDWTGDRFREHAAGWLKRAAGGVPAAARSDVVAASRYHRLDLADTASVAGCVAGADRSPSTSHFRRRSPRRRSPRFTTPGWPLAAGWCWKSRSVRTCTARSS